MWRIVDSYKLTTVTQPWQADIVAARRSFNVSWTRLLITISPRDLLTSGTSMPGLVFPFEPFQSTDEILDSLAATEFCEPQDQKGSKANRKNPRGGK